jgi:UDP-glucose 4-epimerase
MTHQDFGAGAPITRLAGSRVLVTGGCGFIGSHLVEQLVAHGATVWVLDNLQAGTPTNLAAVKSQVTLVIGDVRDPNCVKRVVALSCPDYVFHLAANASVPGSVEDPAYDFETNTAGTFALCDALRCGSRDAKVILASSGAVYGEPSVFPILEAHAEAPISPYGASKACAETLARMFYQVYGLSVIIARIFNTYGPRMARFVILDFLRKLNNNRDVLEVLGNGQQTRDFTYVTDTVQGLLLLSEHGSPAESYNLSSGCSVTVTQLANMVIATVGLTGQTHIAYTGSSWPGDAQRWVVSIEKLRRLGYTPLVDLESGLALTAQWFETMRDQR